MREIRVVARHMLPKPARRWLEGHRYRIARWATRRKEGAWGLWRVTPINPQFRSDRGLIVDRYYIESFLSRHSADVRGHVLEVAENRYTREFGGARVTRSDILHASPGN